MLVGEVSGQVGCHQFAYWTLKKPPPRSHNFRSFLHPLFLSVECASLVSVLDEGSYAIFRNLAFSYVDQEVSVYSGLVLFAERTFSDLVVLLCTW